MDVAASQRRQAGHDRHSGELFIACACSSLSDAQPLLWSQQGFMPPQRQWRARLSGALLNVLSVLLQGPLEGMSIAMDLDVKLGHDSESQSTAFVVVSKPGYSQLMI